MKTLRHLSKPGRIGGMTTRNRIVMPPMVTKFADENGCITQQQIDYYRTRAKGGVGYITFEHTSVSKQGMLMPRVALISNDTHKAHINKLVDTVHVEGCPIVVQINHAGRQASSAVTGQPIVAPSPLPCPVRKEPPKVLRVEEINALVGQFADAAERVKQAGADGVEIQMGHGGLICSFLSPFSNIRDDDYGGSREKRARFAMEILQAVRQRVGVDFPIICRMSLKEYVAGGIELEDTKYYSQCLEKNGADALHLSAASSASIYMNHPPYYVEEGIHATLAHEIKNEVAIPVIAVGRIKNPLQAETILNEGQADFITMGRALISDPFLPDKAFNGQFDDIVPCISCNRCIKSIRLGSLACTVNPEVGKEGTMSGGKTSSPKHVMVVGGGPGGMKAAEIAAKRGHGVSLYEKKDRLGGMILIGAKPPYKSGLMEYVDFQSRQLQKQGVKVKQNTAVTLQIVREENPDAVVLATGSRQILPDMPGIEKVPYYFVKSVYEESVDLGKHTVIVGGGGTGAELADYISEKGIQVTLIEMLDDIATELVPHLSYFLKKRLNDKRVRIETSTKVIEFDRRTILLEGPKGKSKITDFDSIVLASGFEADQTLLSDLQGKVPEIHTVGDAKEPREIIDAVSEGYEVGTTL